MTTFRSELTFLSKLTYLSWRMTGANLHIRLHLRDKIEIALRPKRKRSDNNDYGVAHEVFVQKQYANPFPIPSDGIRSILDLGANVGFSTLWLLKRFPLSKVVSFEPHPSQFAQLKWHVMKNGMTERTTLVWGAAGTCNKKAFLTDSGSSSTIIHADLSLAKHTVAIVDIFEWIGGSDVDLLKMDIEGGEHEILDDERFPHIKCPYIVLEYHSTNTIRNGYRRCSERLTALNYEHYHRPLSNQCGIIWARKKGKR